MKIEASRGRVVRLIWIALALQGTVTGATSVNSNEATSDAAAIEQAKILVDNYYGQRNDLNRAAELVSNVLLTPDPPAEAFIQAARVSIKGGHVFEDRYAPGTIRTAHYFIGRALTLEPDNVSALALKASLAIVDGDLSTAHSALQTGLALQPSYPWLHANLARYYEATQDYRAAVREYGIVVKGGCSNTDSEQRRAFTSAMLAQIRLMRVRGQEALFRSYAIGVDQCRHPKDAWALGELARVFDQVAFFDEAILYARKARGVMDYAEGRRVLAMGLYGKAAQLSLAGLDPSKMLVEAKSLNFAPEEVVGWFASSQADAHSLTAAVAALAR